MVAFGPITVELKFNHWFERESMRRAMRRWTSKAHFYGQMMLISVNAEANKRQRKQLFTKRWPVILKTKRTKCKYPDVLPDHGRVENFEYETNSMQICFVARKPSMLRTKETRKYTY